METLLIQINNKKAYEILKNLEELNVIKVLNKDISQRYFQKKYAGKLPSELADKLHEEIEKGRKEWEKRGTL
ncbi:hypothetical protein ACFQ2C_17825 [Sphingobacterium daejeonense]|uniref:Uncharacterized protein n=1 Tax=Sphingobacterium daejeonense TaxID=371142 RepID=A0ABW3RQJ9_9SPHI